MSPAASRSQFLRESAHLLCDTRIFHAAPAPDERGLWRGLQPTAQEEEDQEGVMEEAPCSVCSRVLRSWPRAGVGVGEDLTQPLCRMWGTRDQLWGAAVIAASWALAPGCHK